jgi:hypothetical protein
MRRVWCALVSFSVVIGALLGLSTSALAGGLAFTGSPELTAAPEAPVSSGPASAEPEISLTPSTTQFYYACPHGACQAISGPPATKTVSGDALPDGAALVGTGVEGGYVPKELQSAYGIPEKGGSGQTVAVIDAYGDSTAEEDLAEYRKNYKLPECKKENVNKEHCFTKINEKGEEGNYPADNAEWELETSIDLDMVSAMCPECHIMLVEAGSITAADLGASVNKAVERGATEVSNSYDLPESYEPWCGKTGCSEYASDYDHPEYGGHPVVITAAAGDYGYDNGIYEIGSEHPLPSFPATSPNVIAVGGTRLEKAEDARGWTEKVWASTGSGCSAFESKPAWQKETEEKAGLTGCPSHRTDNDVAAVGSCATPVSIYSSVYDTKEREHPGWGYECGTSVSTPVIAGIEAHASEYTRSFGADAFYKKPSMLFHISEGSNGECGTSESKTWYLCNATKEGYNGPTGLGTPDGVPAITGAPLAITDAAAGVTLNGTVNPGGLETKYYFQYGTSESYESKTAEASAGSGTSNVEESKAVTGLTLGKTYDFRIVATNSAGTAYGTNQKFTASASPTVETKPASKVGESAATFNGIANPEGAATKYWFQYGTTIAYGKITAQVSIGEGVTNLEESKSALELTPETMYHFRVVASNSNGTTDGKDATFKTAAKGSGNFPQFVPAEGVKFPIALESAKTGEWRMRARTVNASVTCAGSKLKGEITGPKALSLTVELEGCILSRNDEHCTSKGLAEGHMLVDGEGKLVYLSKSTKEVGTILTLPLGSKCGGYDMNAERGQIVALGPVNTKGSEMKMYVRGNGDGESIPGEYENEKGEKEKEYLYIEFGAGAGEWAMEALVEPLLTFAKQFTLEA